MFYQTDERIKLEDRDDECYFFDLLEIFEREANIKLTIEDVEAIHATCNKGGALGNAESNGFVMNVPKIASYASKRMGTSIVMDVVPPSKGYNYLIAKFHRITSKGVEVTHFVLVDKDDKQTVLFDPYSPEGSRTAREGKIVGYRYIKADRLF